LILTTDSLTLLVPNTMFTASPVTNCTYGDPRVRFRMPIGVAYGSDLEKVRNSLLEVARENSHVLLPAVNSVPSPDRCRRRHRLACETGRADRHKYSWSPGKQ